MTSRIVIVGEDPAALMNYVLALQGGRYSVTVVQSAGHPLQQAIQMARGKPEAMIVLMDGTENVVDLRSLLSGSEQTRFLFVSRQMPLRSTLSRIIREHAGVIMSPSEPAIVVAATLVGLLAEQSSAGDVYGR